MLSFSFFFVVVCYMISIINVPQHLGLAAQYECVVGRYRRQAATHSPDSMDSTILFSSYFILFFAATADDVRYPLLDVGSRASGSSLRHIIIFFTPELQHTHRQISVGIFSNRIIFLCSQRCWVVCVWESSSYTTYVVHCDEKSADAIAIASIGFGLKYSISIHHIRSLSVCVCIVWVTHSYDSVEHFCQRVALKVVSSITHEMLLMMTKELAQKCTDIQFILIRNEKSVRQRSCLITHAVDYRLVGDNRNMFPFVCSTKRTKWGANWMHPNVHISFRHTKTIEFYKFRKTFMGCASPEIENKNCVLLAFLFATGTGTVCFYYTK